jgi:dimethylargininase
LPLFAVTRGVSSTLNDCQITNKPRELIDIKLARQQHRAYEEALESLGATIVHLPARDEFPDAVFVEDAAIVVDELAVITTPGAPSRAAEGESLADALARYRPLQRLRPGATLDGGDVIRIGKTLFVGLSTRTNPAGIEQLHVLLDPLGYTVTPVAVRGALHLKTACTYAGRNTLLANPEWCDLKPFAALRIVNVPAHESWGASVLDVNGTLVLPSSYPATRAVLERAGFLTRPVDLSELQKAEGGPTCLSIVITS